jgi:hypothetical protein
MTLSEFMIFVSLVCNFDSPTTQVPSQVKRDCMEYYVNCAIKSEDTVSRLLVSNCNLKAKDASKHWGK